MNRRGFLSTATRISMAATAATWPAFLRSAFAGAAAPGDGGKLAGLAVVSDGFRRAQRAGKPLLVLVIPTADEEKWRRGRALGALLNHGTSQQLWPLSLCEVACASMADLQKLVPSAGRGEPLMVLVETSQIPAAVRRLDVRLLEPEPERGSLLSVSDWNDFIRREEAVIDEQIALLARLVRTAVSDAGQLEQRAAQARAALPPDELSAIEMALAQSAPPGPEQADRGAALLALAAEHAGRRARAAVYEQLGAAVRKRLQKQRVPGSHWATSSGCGTHIEDVEDNMMVACGMGHVPTKSQRFLYFFSLPGRRGRVE